MIAHVKRKVRKYFSRLLRLSPKYSIEKRARVVWYGNLYGGFFVYPDHLHEESIVYSVGIGEDVSFDLQIISKHGCKVFAFDPTPRSAEWIVEQVDMPEGLHFEEVGLAEKDGPQPFFLPTNPINVSGSLLRHERVSGTTVEVPFLRLASIAERNGHDHIDLLKLDIEGAEYDVIYDFLRSGPKIDQLLIEFHHRLVPGGKKRTEQAIEAISAAGMVLIAVSDSTEEFTFVRKTIIG